MLCTSWHSASHATAMSSFIVTMSVLVGIKHARRPPKLFNKAQKIYMKVAKITYCTQITHLYRDICVFTLPFVIHLNKSYSLSRGKVNIHMHLLTLDRTVRKQGVTIPPACTRQIGSVVHDIISSMMGKLTDDQQQCYNIGRDHERLSC